MTVNQKGKKYAPVFKGPPPDSDWPKCEICGQFTDDFEWIGLKMRFGKTIRVARDGKIAHVRCPHITTGKGCWCNPTVEDYRPHNFGFRTCENDDGSEIPCQAPEGHDGAHWAVRPAEIVAWDDEHILTDDEWADAHPTGPEPG